MAGPPSNSDGSPVVPETLDLGNVAILPGLVNAHTHLDLSDLPVPLGPPGIAFAAWIRRVVEHRRRRAGGHCRPIALGLAESTRLGTTTLGDIAQPGGPIEPFCAASVGGTVFLELIAPTATRIGTALEHARQHLRNQPAMAPAWQTGWSPHAPHTVHRELLSCVAALSAAQRVPLAMHLAETREELQLLRTQDGPLRELLEELHAWEPAAIAGARPLAYLHALAVAQRVLVVHGNYLDDEELAYLGGHRERFAVAYCPRTHALFHHAPYPLEKMLRAGVAVALGTDSRASAPDLSVLAEMRLVAARHPAVGGETVLRLGTLCGARALGREDEIGSLTPGKYADLAVVALPDREAADPHELLFAASLPVVATWFRGQAVWPPVGYASA